MSSRKSHRLPYKQLADVLVKYRSEGKKESKNWLVSQIRNVLEETTERSEWGTVINASGKSGINAFHRLCWLLGRDMSWNEDFKMTLAFFLVNGADVDLEPIKRAPKNEEQAKKLRFWWGKVSFFFVVARVISSSSLSLSLSFQIVRILYVASSIALSYVRNRRS